MQKMSSQSSTSSLSLKDIMEKGFLIGASGYSISPGSSCFLEINSLPKSDAWDSVNNIQNLTKSSPLALKVTESPLNTVKGNLQVSCDGGTSFCKSPIQSCTFDLSNPSSANNCEANATGHTFCNTKSSTPCKEVKLSKLTENMLLKSSEMNDGAIFKKPPPPPVWEISGIQATLDNTLPLEASLEELGSLGSMKTDTPSLEMSHFAIPLTSSGLSIAKQQPMAL
ncbi:RNA-directed RNA polymerase [Varanus komodoensis]|nr:RNA-directed RNA polymerase [Varanus komodoensis]